MNNPIYCFSYFLAKKEYREKLILALTNLIEPTRLEPGCLQYELLIDTENSLNLIMLEKFIDQAALDEHENQPYIKILLQQKWNYFASAYLGVSRGKLIDQKKVIN